MKSSPRIFLPLVAVLVSLFAAGCGEPDTPEIVALSYVRAYSSGDPETAVDLLDIERIAERVEEQVMVVDSSGRENFLEDTIGNMLWGLFREMRPADYAFNSVPAEIDGDAATVDVTRTNAEGESEVIAVSLRNTEEGWRVSGESLDDLVRYVVQRLQEKY